MAKTERSDDHISEDFLERALERLREGKSLRRALPGWGRVHIDRQLPFLVVYRRPPGRDDADTDRLVVGEAAYLRASGKQKHHAALAALVQAMATIQVEAFGSFLIIELWAREVPVDAKSLRRPTFRIVRSKGDGIDSTIEALDRALSGVRVKRAYAHVEVVSANQVTRPGMPPLVSAERAAELGCHVIGLELDPVFRGPAGELYPIMRRALHRGLSRALKRAVFEFTRRNTSQRPPHYQALGRRSMVKAVWEVDRQLAEISSAFDLLLQVTPVNADEAWIGFRRKHFERDPVFVSRPLRFDPALAKRQLFSIPIERIEDPTLGQLFRDQQAELDRKLTMVGDRGTPQFLYGSLQVFGGVDPSLLNAAFEILSRVPSRTRDESTRGAVNASDFATRAEQELEYYRRQSPGMNSSVQIRDDVVGLMVSRGSLLVGAKVKIPKSRVEALVAHEVGTHVLTYVNGKSQPFRQLYVGLPGYEELQEGVAVLSEYLVGGLSRPRLRLLAARVVATHRMIEGASFVEVFRELDRAQDFAQRTAFHITMRVFRGGGLTKDAVYLRGLLGLLAYLRQGGDFEQLFIGKFGLDHVPIITELQLREVMGPPPLRPRHMDDPAVMERLAAVRQGGSVLDLVERRAK
ncbi:MAG TPA: tyrosine/phenylalanine carboxypeptidase domain-containing protein [Gemmatimonadales bacterium]|nr:tyrosine/phenylalanine carboxypeptidase domain-containing protein [Gemmatimonadales bacterium]